MRPILHDWPVQGERDGRRTADFADALD